MVAIRLVRHLPVNRHWAGRCYGQSDAGLAADGMRAADQLFSDLLAFAPERIVASPLRRARWLGGHLARETGLPLEIAPRLMEMNFGRWEGRSWDSIWRETGSAMEGYLKAPHAFSPEGGETVFAVRDRAMAWLQEVVGDGARVLAVAHGGPIAAICGTLKGVEAQHWPALVIKTGASVTLDL